MQNQTSIATAAQAGTTTIANAEANNVVEHDTSPLGLPSIKLSGLSMRTTKFLVVLNRSATICRKLNCRRKRPISTSNQCITAFVALSS